MLLLRVLTASSSQSLQCQNGSTLDAFYRLWPSKPRPVHFQFTSDLRPVTSSHVHPTSTHIQLTSDLRPLTSGHVPLTSNSLPPHVRPTSSHVHPTSTHIQLTSDLRPLTSTPRPLTSTSRPTYVQSRPPRPLSRIFWHFRPADHIFRPIFGQPQISRWITVCTFFGGFPAYSG